MTASAAVTHRQHRVDFYDSDAEIVASVVRFLRPAMSGGVAVVVATPEHRHEVSAALLPTLVGPGDGSPSPRLVIVDAERALERFMLGGVPDPAAFLDVMGDLVLQTAEADGPVRVFGEMVALLWRRGNVTAALALEELWNDLAHEHAFSLLCGYPSALFTNDDDGGPFDAVCAQHTSVSVSPHSRLASRAHVSRHATSAEVVERWHFPRDLISGAQARHRLRALLRTWNMDAVLDEAELLTTELVNNAVVHTGSSVMVSVRRRGAALRIEVTDVGGGLPRRLNSDVTASHGRGLMMVESMSSAWGAAVHGASKTIWFELGEPSTS